MRHDLEDRLVKFAVQVTDLTERFTQNPTGFHLGNQIIRSSTSIALNYAEARGAESRRDFKHKLSIALKEARETLVCLKILVEKPTIIKADKVKPLLKESDELVAILVTMVRKVSD